ncbi:MAG: Maf family nucleotide pyrophosphatase [bacterium]|nr:Maf family nucleotide pyrophosphatase [bacterium]
MLTPFFKYKILLASQSPRRQMLLSHSGFETKIIKIDVEEDFDAALKAHEIPVYLAQKKNVAYSEALNENEILVTADTIVWLGDEVLNKPLNMDEAAAMLKRISGQMHTVYTAVCMRSNVFTKTFYDESEVYFNTLSDEMIAYYLENFKPLDKAGAYGIQEFIGYVGIKKIEGCYYNVMGFPVSKFVQELGAFES